MSQIQVTLKTVVRHPVGKEDNTFYDFVGGRSCTSVLVARSKKCVSHLMVSALPHALVSLCEMKLLCLIKI